MIREVEKKDLEECVDVIRKSFKTVADEYGFTQENAPRFTAFSTTLERLSWHYEQEKRPIYVYLRNIVIKVLVKNFWSMQFLRQ